MNTFLLGLLHNPVGLSVCGLFMVTRESALTVSTITLHCRILHRPKFLWFHRVFKKNFKKVGAPLFGSVPLLKEILDPPLDWVSFIVNFIVFDLFKDVCYQRNNQCFFQVLGTFVAYVIITVQFAGTESVTGCTGLVPNVTSDYNVTSEYHNVTSEYHNFTVP